MATESAQLTKLEINFDVVPTKKYKLVMHNDDVTPMDLVVATMVRVCLLSVPRAMELTIEIHENGAGVVLEGTYELMETKQGACKAFMASYGFPDFLVTVEDK